MIDFKKGDRVQFCSRTFGGRPVYEAGVVRAVEVGTDDKPIYYWVEPDGGTDWRTFTSGSLAPEGPR